MPTPKQKQTNKQESIQYLTDDTGLKPGDPIYTLIRSTNQSGSRVVSVWQLDKATGQMYNISYHVARVLGCRYSETNGALTVDEIGTDAQSWVAIYLSRELFGKGDALQMMRL